ncbi:MAG: Dabb family protein, partial [Muribaculaceae bacterium]|nr:Dabb family protein [Muribaculaceae bacterium]
LISTFASIEDMEAYKKHPAHVAISTYCKKVRESRVACDFVIE